MAIIFCCFFEPLFCKQERGAFPACRYATSQLFFSRHLLQIYTFHHTRFGYIYIHLCVCSVGKRLSKHNLYEHLKNEKKYASCIPECLIEKARMLSAEGMPCEIVRFDSVCHGGGPPFSAFKAYSTVQCSWGRTT